MVIQLSWFWFWFPSSFDQPLILEYYYSFRVNESHGLSSLTVECLFGRVEGGYYASPLCVRSVRKTSLYTAPNSIRMYLLLMWT